MGRDKFKKRPRPFVMVPKDMLRSPAWLSLTNAARVAWLHLAADQNGRNEGQLKLTYTQAAELMDPKTFTHALKELQEKGFIVRTKPGGLMGGCAEYALADAWRTWQPPADTAPSKKVQGGKSTPTNGGNPPRQEPQGQSLGVEIHPDTAS